MLVMANIEKKKRLAAEAAAEHVPVPLALLAFGIDATVRAVLEPP